MMPLSFPPNLVSSSSLAGAGRFARLSTFSLRWLWHFTLRNAGTLEETVKTRLVDFRLGILELTESRLNLVFSEALFIDQKSFELFLIWLVEFD